MRPKLLKLATKISPKFRIQRGEPIFQVWGGGKKGGGGTQIFQKSKGENQTVPYCEEEDN